MRNNNGPLESLAAFAICFISGAITTFLLGAYIEKTKQNGPKT